MFIISALIGGISAACASAAASAAAGSAIGGLGAAAGIGLLTKGAVGLAAKGAASALTKGAVGLAAKGAASAVAKGAVSVAAKSAANAAARQVAARALGTCLAASVGKEAGECIVKNLCCYSVKPRRGSILKVDLIGGQASHTGVYLGNDRIAEVTEVDGRAVVRIVGLHDFISGSAMRSGIYIYVAASEEDGNYKALASELIAYRAERAVGERGRYRLASNNCHNFTRYCITGREDTSSCLSAAAVASALRDKFGCGHVSWRSTGCGASDTTFA